MAQETIVKMNIALRTKQFVRDVWDELHKVNWTSRGQLWQATKVVIMGTAVMAVFLWVADIVFAWVLNRFLS